MQCPGLQAPVATATVDAHRLDSEETPMSPSDARQLAYAKAVQARAGAMPPGGAPAPDIIESWARCMDVGLDCHGHAPIAVVDGASLARRRERAEVTRRLAQAELETLAQQIAGSSSTSSSTTASRPAAAIRPSCPAAAGASRCAARMAWAPRWLPRSRWR
jgi:hypothetical protein